jgi:glycine/D-amino acid oxidase-like deaminating enzyme
MLAGAKGLELERCSIGHPPTPAGGFPAIGRAGSRPGLYIAVMHSGFILAPAVGAFVADEILTGRRNALLRPYGAQRLAVVTSDG